MKYLLAVQIYEKLLPVTEIVYTMLELRHERERDNNREPRLSIGKRDPVLLRAGRIRIDDSERRLDSRETWAVTLRRLN